MYFLACGVEREVSERPCIRIQSDTWLAMTQETMRKRLDASMHPYSPLVAGTDVFSFAKFK